MCAFCNGANQCQYLAAGTPDGGLCGLNKKNGMDWSGTHTCNGAGGCN